MRTIIPVCVLLVFAATATARDVTIQSGLAAKVGDRFKVTVTQVKEETRVSVINGIPRPPKETKISYKLVGELETTAVNKAGGASGWKLVVDTFESFDGVRGEELALKGDVIVASHADGKASYELKATDGAKLSDHALEALTDLIKLESDTKAQRVSDVEYFDIPPKGKVGDSWPVNSERAAKLFKVKKENISGKIDLTAVKTYEGVACAEVTGNIKVVGLESIDRELPKGAELKSAELLVQVTKLTPTDGSRSVEDSTTIRELKLTMKLTLPEKPNVMADTISTSKQTSRHVSRRLK